MEMTMVKRADGLTDAEFERVLALRKQQQVDAVLARVEEEGIIAVPCGKMFAKNMWREFRLSTINRNRLAEIVDELVKSGTLSCAEVFIGNNSSSVDAGVVRNRTTTRERLYYLTK